MIPAPDTGRLRGDLIALLQLIRTRFGVAGAQTIRGIVADADDDEPSDSRIEDIVHTACLPLINATTRT